MVRATAMILASCVLPVSPAQSAPTAPRVTAAEYADLVVVTVHDLDLLRAAYPALTAEVRLAGLETVYRVDLAAEYQTPAVLIRKAGPDACGGIVVTLRAGNRELLRQQLVTTPALATEPRLPLTDAWAFIERGAGLRGEAPTIRQPDLAQLPVLPLADAERTVDMNAIVAKVASRPQDLQPGGRRVEGGRNGLDRRLGRVPAGTARDRAYTVLDCLSAEAD